MDSADSSNEDLQLRDLPGLWWTVMTREWADRTAFGKLLYPVWFAWSAMQWTLALVFMSLMWVSKKAVESSETKTIPDKWVYKDE